ncbi:MAG: cadmium resistance transporter [Chloroflexota bacterium]
MTDELGGVVLLGIALFVGTNLDDLLLLVAWFAAGDRRTAEIVAGQYIGVGLLVAISLAGAALAEAVAATNLHLLGLVPLALGIWKVIGLLRGREPESVRPSPTRSVVAVASLTVINGADNVGAYVPVFASFDGAGLLVMLVTFAVMITLWCAAARALVQHPVVGAQLRRHGHILLPIVLIVIGLLILFTPGG